MVQEGAQVQCRKCGELKPRNDFYVNNKKRNGLSSYCKVCAIAVSSAWSRAARNKCLDAYGRECRCCSETEVCFLSFDHVNNDGATHRREVGAGPAMYAWLIKNNFPDSIQVLCHNCNLAKGFYGQCPHRSKSS